MYTLDLSVLTRGKQVLGVYKMGACIVSVINVMSGFKRGRESEAVNGTPPFVEKLLHALLDEEKTMNVVVSPVVVQFVLTW